MHYFHSTERSRSASLSLVALDEALTLLQYGVASSFQFDFAALGTARRASAAFTKTLTSVYLEPATDEPPLPSLDLLRAKGIPTVSDSEFLAATKRIVKDESCCSLSYAMTVGLGRL